MPSMLWRSLMIGLTGTIAVVGTAAGAAGFYQGKQLTVLVNFAPGGPTDAEARLLARHLPRFVRGNPTIAVRTMDGDDGTRAANWLATAAGNDGLVLGYFTRTLAQASLGDVRLDPKVASLTFVASRQGLAVAYARTDIGSGIKVPADLMRRHPLWVGGLKSDGDRDIRLRMQLDLAGVRYKYLPGYSGTAEARLAFQRGDVQVLNELLPSYSAGIEPNLVAAGKALPLWFDPIDDGQSFQRSPRADGIPALTFTDFLVARRGKLPDSELFSAWRVVNLIGTRFLRILMLAPGSPKPAAQQIRLALNEMAEDADFREDAFKALRFVPSFAADAGTDTLYRQALHPDPAIKSIIRRYAGYGLPDRRGSSGKPPTHTGASSAGR